MNNLTKEEERWLVKLQKLLRECPSDRIGFYTIGDFYVTVYDRTKIHEINEKMDSGHIDFCQAVEDCDADFGVSLLFPALVHSVAG